MSVYSKLLMIKKILFTCSGMREGTKSSVAILKPMKVIMKVSTAKKVTMQVNSGYVALYIVNGTMKTVFMSNLSHVMLLYITYGLHDIYGYGYIYIWLKFLIFHRRLHENTELWLKCLLVHQDLYNNTEFS